MLPKEAKTVISLSVVEQTRLPPHKTPKLRHRKKDVPKLCHNVCYLLNLDKIALKEDSSFTHLKSFTDVMESQHADYVETKP